jgi:hypothetical protein
MICFRAGRPAPRRGQHGPDGYPAAAGPDPPAAGQVLDDGQATPAKCGNRRTFGTRPGWSPAVAYRYPQRAARQRPGHPDRAARQRPGVPDRVTQQLAQDQGRIANRGGHHAGFAQIGGEPPTSGRDTGRHVREQDDARCTHLPVPRPIDRPDRTGHAPRFHPGNTHLPRLHHHAQTFINAITKRSLCDPLSSRKSLVRGLNPAVRLGWGSLRGRRQGPSPARQGTLREHAGPGRALNLLACWTR